MKTGCKTSGTGTAIAAACCFGLLTLILGLLGLTAALAYVNKYGDYVFFPAFAIFGTIFIKQVLGWKKNWFTYTLSLIIMGVLIWFMTFSRVFTFLVIGGVVVGLLFIRLFGGKR